MLVCHTPEFVYLRPPRTGTTTCTKQLCSMYRLKRPNGYRHSWPKECNNYFTFITVRNPYTRMFSLWRQATKPYSIAKRSRAENKVLFDGVSHCADLTFKKWVMGSEKRKNYFKYHALCSYYYYDAPKVDAVLRQESLNEHFNNLPFIDCPVKLGQRNGGKTAKWRRHYTAELFEAVADIWSDDFELFNYSVQDR